MIEISMLTVLGIRVEPIQEYTPGQFFRTVMITQANGSTAELHLQANEPAKLAIQEVPSA